MLAFIDTRIMLKSGFLICPEVGILKGANLWLKVIL